MSSREVLPIYIVIWLISISFYCGLSVQQIISLQEAVAKLEQGKSKIEEHLYTIKDDLQFIKGRLKDGDL